MAMIFYYLGCHIRNALIFNVVQLITRQTATFLYTAIYMNTYVLTINIEY